MIIKTLKANFIGVIPNFLFWGIQVTIHMKNEDEGFFVAESAKNWVCYRVGWFFLVPIKLHFGLWYWSCSFAFRICYINKSIKFLLVVIVIDSTIFTKRYFNCIIFWVTYNASFLFMLVWMKWYNKKYFDRIYRASSNSSTVMNSKNIFFKWLR